MLGRASRSKVWFWPQMVKMLFVLFADGAATCDLVSFFSFFSTSVWFLDLTKKDSSWRFGNGIKIFDDEIDYSSHSQRSLDIICVRFSAGFKKKIYFLWLLAMHVVNISFRLNVLAFTTTSCLMIPFIYKSYQWRPQSWPTTGCF